MAMDKEHSPDNDLIAYGDESHDWKKERVFAVGVVWGTRAQWDALIDKWCKLTQDVPFHATDCESNRGRQYRNKSNEENKALYRHLVELLANSGLTGTGAAMDLQAKAKYLVRALPDGEYFRCFAEVITDVAVKARLTLFSTPVQFTFDQRTQSHAVPILLYKYLRSIVECEDFHYLAEEVRFADHRHEIGIQVADLWTREVMKQLDNQLAETSRSTRLSFGALSTTKRFNVRYYREDYYRTIENVVVQMDQNSAVGSAFHPNKYKQWLTLQGKADSWERRLTYLLEHDEQQRKAGNPVYFEDITEYANRLR